MIPVARADGATVYCPVDGMYSFYNSPYPGHRLSTGIDVYPDAGFGDVAPSPAWGEVEQVRKIRSPRGRGFEDPGYDIVTVLRSLENPERAIKLLHVEPVIGVGDEVGPGQALGTLLRSGYFGFGTSPHVHAEIREPSDPLRARGGLPLAGLLNVGDADPPEALSGVVTSCCPEFSTVRLEGVSEHGLPADVGGAPGLLDGGIPYYGWLGAHIGDEAPKGRVVKLLGKTIANITDVLGKVCLADCVEFTVKADDTAVLGLSLRLSPRRGAEVKLIPFRMGGLRLEVDSEVSISIR